MDDRVNEIAIDNPCQAVFAHTAEAEICDWQIELASIYLHAHPQRVVRTKFIVSPNESQILNLCWDQVSKRRNALVRRHRARPPFSHGMQI